MAEVTPADALADVPKLQGLDPDVRAALADRMEIVSFSPGELIQEEDASWEVFCVVTAGAVRLATGRSDTQEALLLDVLREGAHVGTELFFGGTASFSVRADPSEGATLLRLSRAQLQHHLEAHPAHARRFEAFADRRARREVLARSALFGHLSPDRQAALAEATERRTLASGDRLIEEGAPGDEVYLIEEGRFRVFRDEAPEETLQELTAGEVVGEIAVRTGQPRTAHVEAVTEGRVLALGASAFRAAVAEEDALAASVDDLVDARRVALGPDAPAPERGTGTAAERGPTTGHAPPRSDDAEGEDTGEDKNPRDRPYDFREPIRYRFGLYPAVQQQSAMDCGAACLSTVCRYYGKRVSLNHMRRLARVGRSGASMLHLFRAAEELGFEADAFLSTYDQLQERVEAAPAIVNWNGYHWLVVYEAGADEVTVADPASGLVTKSRDEFEEGWTRYTLFLTPTAAVDEIEEEPPTIAQFLPYVRPHTRLLGEIFGASIALQVMGVFVPLFSKFVLDTVIVQEEAEWLVPAIAALGLLLLGKGLLSFFREHLLLYVSRRVDTRMVEDFLEHVLSLPLRYFERRKTGDVTGRFEENRTITSFLTEKGLQPFLNAFTVVVYLGLMAYLNVWLALIATGFLGLHVLNLRIISPRLREAYQQVFEHDVDSEGYLIEVLRGLTTVKALGVERSTRWDWEDLNARYVNSYFESVRYSIASSLTGGIINSLVDVAVLFAGALMVFDGALTIGGLVAVQLLAGSVTAPALALVRVWDEFQEALNAVERLNDVYETPKEIRPAERDRRVELPSLQGHVQFEHVTFRYEEESSTNVIQNVDLQVAPGRQVALVGRSGSGKSTLAKLLLGFYPPSSGAIYVDGFDVQDVWLPSLREQVGMVSQETDLFQETVHQNIAYGQPDASSANVREAARLAYAHEFIEALPQGYDTVLESNGANLSGGQRQRLAIARALLAEPNILVLDEATSALDNEAERYVRQNIEDALECTILTIAHRLSAVRDADEIVVLEQGTVLERGAHDELLANRGLYYYFHTQQLDLS
jgi:ATP-binding cassette subfamily B protein